MSNDQIVVSRQALQSFIVLTIGIDELSNAGITEEIVGENKELVAALLHSTIEFALGWTDTEKYFEEWKKLFTQAFIEGESV